ncbi:unnamed protein product, partial [Mesorhabditis spiculigera]
MPFDRLCAVMVIAFVAVTSADPETTEAVQIFARPLRVGDIIVMKTTMAQGWQRWSCSLETKDHSTVWLNATHPGFGGSPTPNAITTFSSYTMGKLAMQRNDWLFFVEAQRVVLRMTIFTERSLLLQYSYPKSEPEYWVEHYYPLPAAMAGAKLEELQQFRCEGHIRDTHIDEIGLFQHPMTKP